MSAHLRKLSNSLVELRIEMSLVRVVPADNGVFGIFGFASRASRSLFTMRLPE